MTKKLTAMSLLLAFSQTGNALNVISQGNTVFIEDAISAGGVPAQINLVETVANGSRLVPLEQGQGIQYQLEGRNLRISTAGAKGRYQAISIERNENGNRQSMRVSIGGGSSSSIVQSQSSGMRNFNSVPPPPPPKPMPRFQRPQAEPMSASPVREGAYLSNQRVQNEDFAGAELGGMMVVNSRFSFVRFSGANLSASSMTNTRFNQCDLAGADFSGSQMVNARFDRSNLQSANFKGANLVNVKFKDSDLSAAIWLDGRRCKPGSIGQCKL